MLPKTIARQLKYGHRVSPEQYEAVTLCFVEIDNYHDFAERCPVVDVVDFLNSVFSFIDGKLEMFDVYKVRQLFVKELNCLRNYLLN